MIDNYSIISQRDVSLRDYQQEAKNNIFALWDCSESVLFQMPTGTGKTRLFTSIIRDITLWGLRSNTKPHILIIAHRSELIEQISRNLIRYHIEHGIFAGIKKDERDFAKPVQVASVQTITHGNNSRVAEAMHFDFIIIDEAHHPTAASYRKLWMLYPQAKKLGVTATPWRMNGEGFRMVFDDFLPSMSVHEFMHKGWLAPYQYYSVSPQSTIREQIENIKEFDIEGDYKPSALERVVDNDHIRSQLLHSYLTYAKGKKGIIYSISRSHSEHICHRYSLEGISIVNIDSLTPAVQREKYIRDFKAGQIDIIVNVDIFSEGFDCPDIEFVQLARPTKSLVKYIQQVGRGLRRNGNKRCVILDNVGMYLRFGLPDDDRDWAAYFEGNPDKLHQTIEQRSGGMVEIGEQRTPDLSEGQEQMVLVESIEATKQEEDKAESIIGFNPETNNEAISIQTEDTRMMDSLLTKKSVDCSGFRIVSNAVFGNKYFIEENNDGYYFVNKKNGDRVFLLSHPTSLRGTISLRREKKDEFSVVRGVPRGRNIPPRMVLIGTLRRVGLLKEFIDIETGTSLPLYI